MPVESAIIALLIFVLLVGSLVTWMMKPKRGKNLSEGKDEIDT